jgi:ethanolamine utilization cobalamin adenosyltransferase
MIILNYASKKELKENIGNPLNYIETSIFGPEYSPNCKLTGCNRPHTTGHKREFFANVTIVDGKIKTVK